MDSLSASKLNVQLFCNMKYKAGEKTLFTVSWYLRVYDEWRDSLFVGVGCISFHVFLVPPGESSDIKLRQKSLDVWTNYERCHNNDSLGCEIGRLLGTELLFNGPDSVRYIRLDCKIGRQD